MDAKAPQIYLVRHGETVWSRSGRHTGLTDLPLTAKGVEEAHRIGVRLRGISFSRVITSPLKRAFETCELTGFGNIAELDRLLVEWNYGDYEGLTTEEIQAKRPDWRLFRDGCPNGETPEDIGRRGDEFLRSLQLSEGNKLVFSSGHFLRVLVARWLGLEPSVGGFFLLSTSSLSVLGYEHDVSEPVIRLWNDTSHLLTDGSARLSQ